MRGGRFHRFFIFLFAAAIILARPLVVFSSSVLLHALELEVKTYGFARAVRKRKETIYSAEEFVMEEHQPQKFYLLPLQFLLSFLRKWQHQLLLLLSFLFAYLLALSRSIRPYFDLTPQTDRYKTVSVFLI